MKGCVLHCIPLQNLSKTATLHSFTKSFKERWNAGPTKINYGRPCIPAAFVFQVGLWVRGFRQGCALGFQVRCGLGFLGTVVGQGFQVPCNTKRINGLFCRLYRKVLVLLKNRKKQKCSHNAGKFEDRDFGDVPSTGVLENHIFLVFKILKKSFLVC